MDKNSNSFVMMFAVGMCVVLAVLLAGSFGALKDQISANQLFDQQVSVLIATGVYDPDVKAMTRPELEQAYAGSIREKVLEIKRGIEKQTVLRAGEKVEEEVTKVVDMVETEHQIADLQNLRREEIKKSKAERREFTTVYTRVDQDGNPVAYCIPVEGPGLWSVVHGFLALEADLDTVKGVVFFKHGETAGLGGEVSKAWFTANWPGKKIRGEGGDLVGVIVKKGVVDPDNSREVAHYVDGISGATITCDGVTKFIREDLEKYTPYFDKLR